MFAFWGTSLEIHGVSDPQTAATAMTLDNASFTAQWAINTTTTKSSILINNDLDPNVTHTLAVEWRGSQPTLPFCFDHLVIGEYRAA